MKRHVLLFFCTVSLLALAAACTQETYDQGDGEFSLLRADFVEAHVGADRRVDYVKTDDGDSLRAVRPFTVSWIMTADTTYRALLYHSLREGQTDAYSMAQVLVPLPKPASRFKGGVVTDPVYVESCWRARNGRYLNLRLRVMTGDDEVAKSTRHVFGCVNDTLVTQAGSTTTLHLSLYHSQGGQPEYYSREVYLSIPLYDVSADSVRLTVQTYNGLLQKTLATK
jgi:hypothetical protein